MNRLCPEVLSSRGRRGMHRGTGGLPTRHRDGSVRMNAQPSLPPPIASDVGVHTPAPDDSLALLESFDLGFDVLSEIDQRDAAAYRVRFELNRELRSRYEQFDMALTKANADRTWNLPVPATLVIARCAHCAGSRYRSSTRC